MRKQESGLRFYWECVRMKLLYIQSTTDLMKKMKTTQLYKVLVKGQTGDGNTNDGNRVEISYASSSIINTSQFFKLKF